MNTFHFLLRLILVGLVSNIIPEPHAYSSAQITDYSPPSISGPIRQAAGLIHPIAWDVSQIIYNLQPLTNTAPLTVNDTY